MSFNWSVSLWFPHQNPEHIILPPMRPTYPIHPIIPVIIAQTSNKANQNLISEHEASALQQDRSGPVRSGQTTHGH